MWTHVSLRKAASTTFWWFQQSHPINQTINYLFLSVFVRLDYIWVRWLSSNVSLIVLFLTLFTSLGKSLCEKDFFNSHKTRNNYVAINDLTIQRSINEITDCTSNHIILTSSHQTDYLLGDGKTFHIFTILSPVTGCGRRVAVQMSNWPVPSIYLDWKRRGLHLCIVCLVSVGLAGPFLPQVNPQPMSSNLKVLLGHGKVAVDSIRGTLKLLTV